MSAVLALQLACEHSDIPDEKQIQRVLDAVLSNQNLNNQEITVRIVSRDESQQLNREYRDKDKPTNVLSFPFEPPVGVEIDFLGDLVICADIVASEAKQQNKSILHHWSHMIVHGTLHLLGFDHIEDVDADQMEALEIDILSKLEIDDPYQDH